VALRVAIGWHFLYEGLVKNSKPNFSSVGYLNQAKGPLADFYHGMVPDVYGFDEMVTAPAPEPAKDDDAWREQVVNEWEQHRARFASYYNLNEEQSQKTQDLLKEHTTNEKKLTGHLKKFEKQITAYFTERDQLVEQRDGADSDAEKAKSQAKLDKLEADADDRWRRKVSDYFRNFRRALAKVLDGKQKARGTLPSSAYYDAWSTKIIASWNDYRETARKAYVITDERLEELKESHEKLKESHEKLKESREELKESHEEATESEEKLKELEEKLAESQEKLKELEEKLAESEEELKAFEKKLKEFPGKSKQLIDVHALKLLKFLEEERERPDSNLGPELGYDGPGLIDYRRERGRLVADQAAPDATGLPYQQQRLAKRAKTLSSAARKWKNFVKAEETALIDELWVLAKTDAEVVVPEKQGFSSTVDCYLPYGLMAIGFCLIVGLFTRSAAVGAVLFLLSIVLAQPSLPGIFPPPPPSAGNTFLVNKEVIEMIAAAFLASTIVGRFAGVDFFLHALFSGQCCKGKGKEESQ